MINRLYKKIKLSSIYKPFVFFLGKTKKHNYTITQNSKIYLNIFTKHFKVFGNRRPPNYDKGKPLKLETVSCINSKFARNPQWVGLFFFKLLKNIMLIKIFLIVLLNFINRFDLKTC
jgi:hypothetical protein